MLAYSYLIYVDIASGNGRRYRGSSDGHYLDILYHNSFHVVGSSLEVAISWKATQFLHLEESSATTVCDISALPRLELRYITTAVASQPGKRPNRRVWWCRSVHRCCTAILKSHQLLSFGRHPIAPMRTCGGLSSAFVSFHFYNRTASNRTPTADHKTKSLREVVSGDEMVGVD